jgi:undecaprenyl-phosphate 4-deoxy-4-formamido-L-arabinose transferase
MSTTLHERPLLISVVVPVHGDGRDLDDLTTRLQAVLDRSAHWELILVNDGSPPPAWDRITHLAASRDSIKGIDLQQNAGQHNAILAGIRASSGDVVVTMDDDLQHPPEEVPALLKQLEESGDDIVYGTPFVGVHGHRRQVGGSFARRLVAYTSGVPEARIVSAFRAFKGTLRPAFAAYDGPQVFIDGVLCRASRKVSAVAVRHDPRRHGRSGYGLRRLIAVAMKMTAAFGVSRARIVALCAGGAVSIGVGLLLWRAASMQPVLTAVVSAGAIAAGSVILAAGVACAALARHDDTQPGGAAYAIRRALNLDNTAGP